MGVHTRILARKAVRTVERRTAQVAEENFFERLHGAIRAARLVRNPIDGRTYEITASTSRVRTLDSRLDELKELVKRFVDRGLLKTYDEMPKSGVVVYEVCGRSWAGLRSVRVVVAGAAMSPVEDLLRQGESSRPLPAAELLRLREEVARHQDVFHFLCAFATTSWEEDALDTLSGTNYLMALADIHEDAWRVRFAPDSRWDISARLFDLTTWEEKMDAIRRFVDRHVFELLMDEMTEEYVLEHLGYPPAVIREAFERIAQQTPFVRYDATARPSRLVRVYT